MSYSKRMITLVMTALLLCNAGQGFAAEYKGSNMLEFETEMVFHPAEDLVIILDEAKHQGDHMVVKGHIINQGEIPYLR